MWAGERHAWQRRRVGEGQTGALGVGEGACTGGRETYVEGGFGHDARLCCFLQRAASIGLSPLPLDLPFNPLPPQAAVPTEDDQYALIRKRVYL